MRGRNRLHLEPGSVSHVLRLRFRTWPLTLSGSEIPTECAAGEQPWGKRGRGRWVRPQLTKISPARLIHPCAFQPPKRGQEPAN